MRLARWAAGVVPLIALGVMVIGPRADASIVIRATGVHGARTGHARHGAARRGRRVRAERPGGRAPGRSSHDGARGRKRVDVRLIARLLEDGDPVRRLLVLPIHSLCVIEIAGFGIVPAWALFAMLRRAAPLRPAWSGALATLAAAALGAAATQVLCPIDDPAHQLVGHVLPVILLAAAGTLVGRRAFDWLPRDQHRHHGGLRRFFSSAIRRFDGVAECCTALSSIRTRSIAASPQATAAERIPTMTPASARFASVSLSVPFRRHARSRRSARLYRYLRVGADLVPAASDLRRWWPQHDFSQHRRAGLGARSRCQWRQSTGPARRELVRSRHRMRDSNVGVLIDGGQGTFLPVVTYQTAAFMHSLLPPRT